MSIGNLTAGERAPQEFNVVIEIPMNADPIKYEVDKESGVLFVDRFMMTAMHYPANYGYVPRTIAADNDPVDVLVHTPIRYCRVWSCGAERSACCAWKTRPATMRRCSRFRPTTPLFVYWKSIEDVPEMRLKQIQHFFQHYKDLEPGKWVRVVGWSGVEAAHEEISRGMRRQAESRPVPPRQ